MDLFDISGSRVIVTGGSRGLGKGMAEGFLEAGCHVVIFGSSDKVADAEREFRGCGYDCTGIRVDLRKEEERVWAYKQATDILGGLDVLVHCAGIQRRHPAEEFPLNDWEDILQVNLTAAFRLSQMAAKTYLAKDKPYGKIINIASMLSFFGGYTVPAYAASKGGMAQMTKAFCNELAGRGINVNALAPGYMATELNTALMDPENPRYQTITDRIPTHRWGTGDDMKGAVIFLASHASDYINGAVIPVDGGYLVR